MLDGIGRITRLHEVTGKLTDSKGLVFVAGKRDAGSCGGTHRGSGSVRVSWLTGCCLRKKTFDVIDFISGSHDNGNAFMKRVLSISGTAFAITVTVLQQTSTVPRFTGTSLTAFNLLSVR